MRSRNLAGTFVCLLGKEWRELMACRSWWLLLLLIGPLVGFSFIDAVRIYGELSGIDGTAGGTGEAFSPLIGIWGPTFGACELAAAFLLPFVAIRLFAADRQDGSLLLELQQPFPAFGRVLAKMTILMAAWGIASMAPLAGVALWRIYGGSVYPPEVATALLGHVLNAGLAVALAAAAAAITEHPSTAAIMTLAVTVGGWILNFVAAVNGGFWERLAGYTPTTMVAEFQHGLIRLEVVFAAMALTALGLGVSAVWIQLGMPMRRRVGQSIALASVTIALLAAGSFIRPSWDTSEARLNSFTSADEQALAALDAPLRIEAHLAPEDPRRSDLERNTFTKLRRAVSDLRIDYIAETSTGLVEQTREHYGEIHYRLGGRERISRATTTEGVLDDLFALAEIAPEEGRDEGGDEVYRGHPLAVTPRGAALVFYLGWPAAVAGMVLKGRGRGS